MAKGSSQLLRSRMPGHQGIPFERCTDPRLEETGEEQKPAQIQDKAGNYIPSQEEIDEGLILTCISTPKTKNILIDYDDI